LCQIKVLDQAKSEAFADKMVGVGFPILPTLASSA